MRVACLQMAAYDLAQAEAALARALAMIDEAAAGGADLIVLPECAYPAYFLRGRDDYARAKLRSWDELVALFGAKAREHRCHIVLGAAQPAPGNAGLWNAAVLFGPSGQMLGATAKSFLWHFDRHWFRPGTQYPVFDTPLGRLGMLICADGRMPEIARSLALQGAQVVIDATAWVTGGGERQTLTSPQSDYMIPTRALENGVWVVAASRVGLEAGSILYCGRSGVIDPWGKRVAMASPDREEVVFSDIDPAQAPGIPVSRRPEVYGTLIVPVEQLPVTRLLGESVVPEAATVRVAALQLAGGRTVAAYLRRVEELVDALARQDTGLVVLPETVPMACEEDAASTAAAEACFAQLTQRLGCGLAATLVEHANGTRYRTCTVWDAGRAVARYRKVHPEAGYSAGDDLPVFATRFGRLGIMLGEEGLVPEVPRSLMLQGADTILWPAGEMPYPLQTVARSRADENKVHVVLAAPVGHGTALVSPTGQVLAAALPDVEQAIGAQVVWALARCKEMAPGTHVVRGRKPEAYGRLVCRE